MPYAYLFLCTFLTFPDKSDKLWVDRYADGLSLWCFSYLIVKCCAYSVQIRQLPFHVVAGCLVLFCEVNNGTIFRGAALTLCLTVKFSVKGTVHTNAHPLFFVFSFCLIICYNGQHMSENNLSCSAKCMFYK